MGVWYGCWPFLLLKFYIDILREDAHRETLNVSLCNIGETKMKV